MNFYRLAGRKQPWGGYGSILAFGMSRHLGRKDGLLQLERTGPFVPPITFPGLGDVVVKDAFREELERSGFTGLTFSAIAKARIVLSDWHTWDRTAPKPLAYPEGGEPEAYILGVEHSPNLSHELGELWELAGELAGSSETRGDESIPGDREIFVHPAHGKDFFRPRREGGTFVSQRAAEWLLQRVGEWVDFKPARVERSFTNDELLEALRERVRVAPGATTVPSTIAAPRPPMTPESLDRAEATLGVTFPPLLRRMYLEIADGGFGPGHTLYPRGVDAPAASGGETPPAGGPGFPASLIPICEWGCGTWSLLDSRGDDGPIVTMSGDGPLVNTGSSLRDWMSAWLNGADLWSTMFEPGPPRTIINPFTGKPTEVRSGQGKPRGTPWR